MYVHMYLNIFRNVYLNSSFSFLTHVWFCCIRCWSWKRSVILMATVRITWSGIRCWWLGCFNRMILFMQPCRKCITGNKAIIYMLSNLWTVGTETILCVYHVYIMCISCVCRFMRTRYNKGQVVRYELLDGGSTYANMKKNYFLKYEGLHCMHTNDSWATM